MVKPKRYLLESLEDFQKRAAKEYYNYGFHIAEIANLLNISEVKAYNLVTGDSVITEEDREEIIRRYNAGESTSEIARSMGVSEKTIRRRIKTPPKPISHPNPSNQLTEDQLIELRTRYLNGDTISTISSALGISTGSVAYRLRKSGFLCSSKSKYKPITNKDTAKFRKLKNKGLTYKQISEKCGWSISTIRKYLRK